jgi:FKBP-type peptidyl-prolyl cis-trans isomerase SlpA
MAEAQSIHDGSQVSMHFTIRLSDGTIAETTREDNEPFEFTIGDGSMIEVLELAIIGLHAGDKQTLLIDPEDAFGFPDDENIQWMLKSDFSDVIYPKPGLIIEFETPSGLKLPGMILEVKDEKVKVDFNHPLAGHEIEFSVEILSVKNSSIQV